VLAFAPGQTVHTFELKSLEVEEKLAEGAELKAFSEARAPLDLAQRGAVSLLGPVGHDEAFVTSAQSFQGGGQLGSYYREEQQEVYKL
jgi:hypothetical protein